ncbi:metallophosphoesterase [Allobaculum mucilyticum]|uniref:metallophosphoesterase n=1 Tax=Allobaculum mucilyticum TaxID=2834459 RepID=UPI001E598528|nr:metallophosphoesterase [Allobaculum mucilyticum]UNT96244.1 metallophosphoesterase family protein [Allobaculum mucilyticum]
MTRSRYSWLKRLCIPLAIASIGLEGYQALRQDLQTSRYDINAVGLPAAFDGLRILHLSDLHGSMPEGLLETCKTLEPDLIFCTGDMYDGVQHAAITDNLLDSLTKLAPVYLVGGNHEYYAGSWNKRAEKLEGRGIHVMDDRVLTLHASDLPRISKDAKLNDGADPAIEIAGLADPDLRYTWSAARRLKEMKHSMQQLPEKKDFRLLLYHRADLFEQTAPLKADVVFSGHLHGGQWRFFNHGLLAPDDGDRCVVFPKYDAGVFERDDSALVVSRGLGDQMKVPRLFNRPEVILVTLHSVAELY